MKKFLPILLLSLLLASCNNSPAPSAEQTPPAQQTDAANTAQPLPYRIKEDYADNLHINAVINFDLNEKRTVGIIKREVETVSIAALEAIFERGRAAAEELHNDKNFDKRDDDAAFLQYPEDLSEFMYGISSEYVFGYISHTLRWNPEYLDYNLNTWPQNVELPFATVEETVERAKNDFASVGITAISLDKVYSIDHNELQRWWTDNVLTDIYEFSLDPEKNERVKKLIWTEADDFYLIFFKSSASADFYGIDVNTMDISLQSEAYVGGAQAIAIYSPRGCVFLQAKAICREDSEVLSEVEIISGGAAIDAVVGKYTDIISDNDYTIAGVELRYFYKSTLSQQWLEPVWLFAIIEKYPIPAVAMYPASEGTRTFWVLIDAVTGVEFL
ncbi:MAG: hypothetical protein LBO63_06935 [Oscillospiraceae bacterium]|jgi:hypothetical protein|nr:hypothetical protein [Oscillospiraceae bacterium]